MKVICSSEESLYRPEAYRWRERMQWIDPIGEVVVVLPCSMKKPYSNSQTHQKFRIATKGYQEVIVTSPFGICPREMENSFPIQSYDVSVSGDWSFEEKKLAGELLKGYVGDKDVVAHVSGGYEEVCREYLDDCAYTSVEGRPASNDSIYKLRMKLKKYNKIESSQRALNKLRSIATYQFGSSEEGFISDDTIAKGMYPMRVFIKNKLIAFLDRGFGLFSLRLPGGEILRDLGINLVEIDFDLKTNNLFAPGVVRANNKIIPNDEVVIVRNDEVVGVGKAILTGEEMENMNNGIAVRIKDRKK